MTNLKALCIKLTALVLILNLIILGPGVSVIVAQEATAENSQTGSSSGNTATNTSDQTSNTTNTNDATATNTTNGTSDSGNNTASTNTGSGSVSSSDASTGTSTTTTTNTTVYDPMPWTTWTGVGDWQSRSENNTTGSNSTNTATNTGTNTNNLTNNNTATVNNTTNAGSNTGTNTSSNNTGNADINTGNAATTVSNATQANTNYWTGEGDWTNLWNGEALNYRTGSGSNNTSTIDVDNIINVLNQNGVDISNLINAGANSGNNIASDNTGNATITTGDTSVLSSLFNLANTNIFGTDEINILYQDIYGSFGGNINLADASSYQLSQLSQGPVTLGSSNEMTGFNSDNVAQNSGSLVVDFFNDNDGVLDNDLNLSAISGGNTTSDNTGNAFIETGDADIVANLINMLNTNVFTDSFYLGMINVFGDWNGNLILPEYSASTSSGASINGLASNELTGANSNNSTINTATDDLNLTNNNLGTVNNTYDVTVESGNNSASDNTLNGSVTSGDAAAEVNQANFVNTNVVSANPWWIVLVNNMGVWTPFVINQGSGSAQVLTDLDQLASNTMTGSQSDNTSSNTNSTDINITNDNNGVINNNITAEAITGNNFADRNTGNGSVETGDASVVVNSLNFLNTNIIAPSVMLTVINVVGNWTGNIFNFGQSPTTQPQGGTGTGSGSGSSGGGSGSSSTPTGSNNPQGGSVNNPAPVVKLASVNGSATSQNSAPSLAEDEEELVVEEESEGQVLSFAEESDESQPPVTKTAGFNNINFIYLAIGFITALGLVALYLLRSQLLKLARRQTSAV